MHFPIETLVGSINLGFRKSLAVMWRTDFLGNKNGNKGSLSRLFQVQARDDTGFGQGGSHENEWKKVDGFKISLGVKLTELNLK